MEHESEPTPPAKKPQSYASVIIKVIVSLIVIFVVAVGLVFGACLLA